MSLSIKGNLFAHLAETSGDISTSGVAASMDSNNGIVSALYPSMPALLGVASI